MGCVGFLALVFFAMPLCLMLEQPVVLLALAVAYVVCLCTRKRA